MSVLHPGPQFPRLRQQSSFSGNACGRCVLSMQGDAVRHRCRSRNPVSSLVQGVPRLAPAGRRQPVYRVKHSGWETRSERQSQESRHSNGASSAPTSGKTRWQIYTKYVKETENTCPPKTFFKNLKNQQPQPAGIVQRFWNSLGKLPGDRGTWGKVGRWTKVSSIVRAGAAPESPFPGGMKDGACVSSRLAPPASILLPDSVLSK